MGVLLAGGIAFIFSLLGLFTQNKFSKYYPCLSLFACALMPIIALYDIYVRLNRNDLSGILTIYPTMGIIIAVIIVIVMALYFMTLWIKKEPNEHYKAKI